MKRWQLIQAREIIQNGGIIAYPTEAVYGLGCDPLNQQAVTRILSLKNRPVSKGLIVIAADFGQISEFVCFDDDDMKQRVLATWPGPVTWLLPATDLVPHWVRGKYTSVAVRISREPVVRQLCTACGPLISTSANPANCAPARTAHRTRNYFNCSVDMILSGRVGQENKQPTEIRDARSGKIIRNSS